MTTESEWKAYRREYMREINQRDRANEERMYASQFARLHKINPHVLRKKMRAAGYKREGGRHQVPVKDLERFLEMCSHEG